MIIILIVAAVISGITAYYEGESFADVIIIMAVVIINAVLGVVQESKAEAAIAALQEIAAATSKVLRDGKLVTLKYMVVEKLSSQRQVWIQKWVRLQMLLLRLRMRKRLFRSS